MAPSISRMAKHVLMSASSPKTLPQRCRCVSGIGSESQHMRSPSKVNNCCPRKYFTVPDMTSVWTTKSSRMRLDRRISVEHNPSVLDTVCVFHPYYVLCVGRGLCYARVCSYSTRRTLSSYLLIAHLYKCT